MGGGFCIMGHRDGTGRKIYHADPGSPWQWPSFEINKSLIREFLPKDANLNLFQNDGLDMFEWLLNTRPRTMSGANTPLEADTDLVKEALSNQRESGHL